MTDPTYLGDGVYAHIDDIGRLVLTTGHHEPAEADNTIILEPEVINGLCRYVDKHWPECKSDG